MNNNTIILKKENLLKGLRENTYITDNYEIVLDNDVLIGSFESYEIDTIQFSELVTSWNSNTSPESFVEIQLKIKVDNKWSQWFSYGKWSDNGNNIGSMSKQQDLLGKMDVDVITTNGDYKGSKVKFKIILKRNNKNVKSPKVSLIAITLTPYKKMKNNKEFTLQKVVNGSVDIEVPLRSQMVVSKIGNEICSPTSLAMLMSYYGLDKETFDVAYGCRDNGSGMYGNWSYNMAYAGEQGFEAYVMKCNSIEEIKEFIIEGIPVAASIKTKDQEELDGSVMAHPWGHLLVIRGFKYKDGESYVIVNDPAAPKIIEVKRAYKINEFNKAWNKYIYVIKPIDQP